MLSRPLLSTLPPCSQPAQPTDGFQLLHAVHAVETFLAKLRDRGCIFNILWFDEEADACMPPEVKADISRASKYRLARTVLIQHFACPTRVGEEWTPEFSRVFPSVVCPPFAEYLNTHPLHFFLGSKAHDVEEGNTPLRTLHLMSLMGYCVAFIEGVEFRSSKVCWPGQIFLGCEHGIVSPLPVYRHTCP